MQINILCSDETQFATAAMSIGMKNLATADGGSNPSYKIEAQARLMFLLFYQTWFMIIRINLFLVAQYSQENYQVLQTLKILTYPVKP